MLPANIIDHTLLKPEATRSEIQALCAEALEHEFASVCVAGSWVELCARRLSDSGVNVTTVVGFPHGATTSGAKAKEAAELVSLGAEEIDMVAALGRILDGDWNYVERDILGVVEAAAGCLVKVILETAILTPAQIARGCAIAMAGGARFVKTSTGFHPAGGATESAVALMYEAVGGKLGIKAAGGIQDRDTALRMVAAGATRIGTSKGVSLVQAS